MIFVVSFQSSSQVAFQAACRTLASSDLNPRVGFLGLKISVCNPPAVVLFGLLRRARRGGPATPLEGGLRSTTKMSVSDVIVALIYQW